jgi:hypothetical protein
MQAEEHAWTVLSKLETQDVCRRAVAAWIADSGCYRFEVFGYRVAVSPSVRSITGQTPDAEAMLAKGSHFLRLSILHYLIGVKAIPLSGRLVRPQDFKGAPTFFEGGHTLPLPALAARYANSKPALEEQSAHLHGQALPHGDAAVKFLPFPRLPVTLVLWRGDGEFPERADILFDSTCEQHVPADVLWATAVLTLKILLS